MTRIALIGFTCRGENMANQGENRVPCPSCGQLNLGYANYCSGCGSTITHGTGTQESGFQGAGSGAAYASGPPLSVPNVPNYLVQAILVTVFCCVPLGIVSIVFSAQVNGKLAAGDYAGAVETSNKAKKWAWWSFGVGLASVVIWIPCAFIGALAGA